MNTKKTINVVLILIMLIVIFLAIGGAKIKIAGVEYIGFLTGDRKALPHREIPKQELIKKIISDEKISAITLIKENKDIELVVLRHDQVSVGTNTQINEKAIKRPSFDLFTQVISGSSNAHATNYPPNCPHSYNCITIVFGGDTWHGCWCK